MARKSEKALEAEADEMAAEHGIKVKAHKRAPRGTHPKPAPTPGKFNFSAQEEQAMRQARQAPPQAGPMGGDEDDLDGGM